MGNDGTRLLKGAQQRSVRRRFTEKGTRLGRGDGCSLLRLALLYPVVLYPHRQSEVWYVCVCVGVRVRAGVCVCVCGSVQK